MTTASVFGWGVPSVWAMNTLQPVGVPPSLSGVGCERS